MFFALSHEGALLPTQRNDDARACSTHVLSRHVCVARCRCVPSRPAISSRDLMRPPMHAGMLL
eukprot:4910777-Pleurochrysis_carterae.AAC.1